MKEQIQRRIESLTELVGEQSKKNKRHEVVKIAYAGGFSVAEIAAVMNLSEGTVYRWLRSDPVNYYELKQKNKNCKPDFI